MSIRLLSHRLFKHGRYFVQYLYRRNINTNILEQRSKVGPSGNIRARSVVNQQAVRTAGLFRFGHNARRLFIDNLLHRVTSTYSADLRAEASKKLFFGDSTPFFALVGVSLASGTGILTKDDELEGVCWEIREAVARLQQRWEGDEFLAKIDDDFSLKHLNIGPPISKGSAAVVYAASLKQSMENSDLPSVSTSEDHPFEIMPPIQNTSRFIHNINSSVDNSHFTANSNEQFHTAPHINSLTVPEEKNHYERSVRFNLSSNISIDSTKSNDNSASLVNEQQGHRMNTAFDPLVDDLYQYPLALKMMFNYDIQSNAMAILRAMYKETIPSRTKRSNENVDNWEMNLINDTVSLPAHPNIVLMFGSFCDQIPNLRHSIALYPMALPPRINPDGYGRNMSLFLVMKRYSCSLYDYLETRNDITNRTRILLFAQLLEAVAHLYRYGVAHRDLKSDNILIDLNGDLHPILVLSDFGCCLADKSKGLQIPYTSHDIDKGGNAALMAPEIINKNPGAFSVLNYTKSDLWACGTIAYELFGQRNPFYPSETGGQSTYLKNVSYAEIDLPMINSDVPILVRRLVENILQRNPNNRLAPDVAANVMQLFLWAPSTWLQSKRNPSSTEILQWLLSLTTKVLCESRKQDTMSMNGVDAFGYHVSRRTYTEYLLISSFLVRVRLQRIRLALEWIQSIY